jgi:hypothetical protein
VTLARASLIVLILGAAGAAMDAQSRTSDAVSALLRGDYQQAATILQPIVESRQQLDPAAAFFMATLYDNGRGVPADPLRACALYQQASFDHTSVYAPTAQLLQRRLWMAHGNEWFAECQLVSNIGLDHRFEPKTFTLGAGHSVEWTLGAATVTYENRTKRAPWWGVGSPRGVMFLPIQYTALRTVASPAPLHFFELFWWEPSAAQWTLRGRLFELYRDELVTVGSTDALTTAAAADPPSLTRSDLETMMNVRLNADGAVEWTVGGARPATRPVATRAETVAAREKERARAEAEARIDWDATLDVNRAPSMTYADAQGCGMFLLFAPSLDRGEVMTFRVDAESLALTPQPRRFDLAKDRRAFSLRIYVYERRVRADPCSDLRMPMPAEVAWQAVSGVVEVEVGIDPVARNRRRATVRILGAEFEGPAGKKIRLTRPILLSAIVGGVSG